MFYVQKFFNWITLKNSFATTVLLSFYILSYLYSKNLTLIIMLLYIWFKFHVVFSAFKLDSIKSSLKTKTWFKITILFFCLFLFFLSSLKFYYDLLPLNCFIKFRMCFHYNILHLHIPNKCWIAVNRLHLFNFVFETCFVTF